MEDRLCLAKKVELENIVHLLEEQGRSDRTIDKYMRDIQQYISYAAGETAKGNELDGDQIFAAKTARNYLEFLKSSYKVSSVNSKVAAVNYYFKATGHHDIHISNCRMQREMVREDYKELTKEDYQRLLAKALESGKIRLYMIMMTLATTGIRISELKYITVESLDDCRAYVALKGKSRVVVLPRTLCERLKEYVKTNRILHGSVFITRRGQPIDRSNILHEMKRLGREAGIDERKIFPHNFRHLFAVTYYQKEKDICHLADILGHSNINTTRIYTITGQEEHMKTIEQLGLF